MMESGTIPPPRAPLTDREKFLLKRLIDAAETLERGLVAHPDKAIRNALILGFDVGRARTLDQDGKTTYMRGLIEGCRRAAYFVDAPPQGIA